jgi:hypothetical protein
MKKFRIVQIIGNVNEKERRQPHFIIQQKKFWGWKDVVKQEVKETSIFHKTREEAEQYMYDNYTGHGEMTIIGNTYIYEPYTYSY